MWPVLGWPPSMEVCEPMIWSEQSNGGPAVSESSTFEAPHGIATMTPEQLAEAGIPATVALRARAKEAARRHNQTIPWSEESRMWGIRSYERQFALAILEAQGER
jgi:hypothetical protein